MRTNDRDIEQAVKNAYEPITFSWQTKERMIRSLTNHEEEKIMKKWTVKKTAIVAAVCAMAVGGTAFAADKGAIRTIVSHSNSASEYTDFADLAEVEKEAGFAIEAVESFESADITFTGANIHRAAGLDEENNTVAKWNEIDLTYHFDDGRVLFYNAEPAGMTEAETGANAQDSREIAGVTVYYSEDEYLFLPPSAESDGTLTDELKERDASDPHFFVSFGSEAPETKFFVHVAWEKDGIRYLLHSFDGVSKDELYACAEEILSMQ